MSHAKRLTKIQKIGNNINHLDTSRKNQNIKKRTQGVKVLPFERIISKKFQTNIMSPNEIDVKPRKNGRSFIELLESKKTSQRQKNESSKVDTFGSFNPQYFIQTPEEMEKELEDIESFKQIKRIKKSIKIHSILFCISQLVILGSILFHVILGGFELFLMINNSLNANFEMFNCVSLGYCVSMIIFQIVLFGLSVSIQIGNWKISKISSKPIKFVSLLSLASAICLICIASMFQVYVVVNSGIKMNQSYVIGTGNLERATLAFILDSVIGILVIFSSFIFWVIVSCQNVVLSCLHTKFSSIYADLNVI